MTPPKSIPTSLAMTYRVCVVDMRFTITLCVIPRVIVKGE